MDFEAFDRILQLSAGQYLVRSLHVAAELGVADAVAPEGTEIAAVAARVGADADALGRVLRLLASRGIFRLDGTRVFHTPSSELLSAAHPASLSSFARMFAQPIHWQSAGRLLHATRTGEAVAALVHPEGGLWGYYRDNPEEGRVFDAAMQAKSAAQIAGIVGAYDFAQHRRIVDVGGGGGHLLRAILARAPESEAVLFDLPPVIETARAQGEVPRLELVAGDFLASAIPAGDCVILQEILHDWDDASCARILQAVRRSMAPGARLLVIEIEMPRGDGPDWPKLLDIVMLAAFAGRQRYGEEYEALLAANGFTPDGKVDTGVGVAIYTARAA